MTCKFIGKPIETAEMDPSVPTVAQSFIVGSVNKVLSGAIVGLCVENPVMTALTLELWSDNGTGPSVRIAISTNSKTRSQLLAGSANNYGFGWFGFTFAGIPLRAGAKYWLALRCTGYTYTAAQHLAWKNSYPTPPHTDGITLSAIKGAEHPLDVSIITADL